MAPLAPTPITLKDGRALTLRSALPADIPALCALTASVTNERAFTLFEPHELADAALRTASRVRERHNDPDELRMLAVIEHGPTPADASSVVGDLSIGAGRWARLAHCATVGIDIHRDYRRAGLGDAMLTTALAWAAAHPRIERVELYVYADNAPAIALYRKHGFLQEGRRARYFKTPEGAYFDDLIMARTVK
ncbi:MAG: GNAT family N-acetyltransferase [Phycisphaerales bacterium]